MYLQADNSLLMGLLGTSGELNLEEEAEISFYPE
jgi:hypothetical protein